MCPNCFTHIIDNPFSPVQDVVSARLSVESGGTKMSKPHKTWAFGRDHCRAALRSTPAIARLGPERDFRKTSKTVFYECSRDPCNEHVREPT